MNKPEAYRQVFRSFCRSKDAIFLVLAKKNGLNQARLGLAISKKQISKAVKRNQIKRALRESFRHHQNFLKALDIIIVSQGKLTVVNNKVIIQSIQAHWRKISQCKKF